MYVYIKLQQDVIIKTWIYFYCCSFHLQTQDLHVKVCKLGLAVIHMNCQWKKVQRKEG